MKTKKCFVIMPISGTTEKHTAKYWDLVFADIKEIVELNGFECSRSEEGPFSLIENIIRQINDSDLVVAVLTDYNKNVWYELGIRHAFKNGTIMLMENGNILPFDISSYGVILYSDLNFRKELQPKIESFLKKFENGLSDNPVQATLKQIHNEKLVLRLTGREPEIKVKDERRTSLGIAMTTTGLAEKFFEILDKNNWCIDKKDDIKHQIVRYIKETETTEFENKCMNLIESIIKENRAYTRSDAIVCVEQRLKIAESDAIVDEQVCAKYRRVIKEFEIATDEEYNALHKCIWE